MSNRARPAVNRHEVATAFQHGQRTLCSREKDLTVHMEQVCCTPMAETGTASQIPRRAEWLDVARVVATLGIVFYHMNSCHISPSAQPELVAGAKALLGVPGGVLAFFFVVSGYFCKPDMPVGKWVKRIVMLLVGYVVWNLLYAPGLNAEPTLGRIFGVGCAGAVCADYPLWYIRALILMMLVLPLFRRCVWLYALLGLAGTVWGNSWHCDWLESIPFPAPFSVLMFAAGSLFSCVSLPKMRRFFLYTAPVWAAGCAVIHWGGLSLPYLHLLSAALLLLSLGALLAMVPRVGCFIAKCADASYLCYAAHAGTLLAISMVLQRYLPDACNSSGVYCLLPFAVYAACVAAMRLMRAHAPWLLPWLAHEGKLPFLK